MAGASQSITLEIENAAEVKAAFQELAARLNDLTPVFRDIGEAMLNSTRARFSSQTAPDGSPWAALSPDYQARKKKNADKILTLYGNLAALLNYQPAPMRGAHRHSSYIRRRPPVRPTRNQPARPPVPGRVRRRRRRDSRHPQRVPGRRAVGATRSPLPPGEGLGVRGVASATAPAGRPYVRSPGLRSLSVGI